MTIFKNYIFTWWQVAILKLALFTIGIAIGANWSQFFINYVTLLSVVGIILAAYIGYLLLAKKL